MNYRPSGERPEVDLPSLEGGDACPGRFNNLVSVGRLIHVFSHHAEVGHDGVVHRREKYLGQA